MSTSAFIAREDKHGHIDSIYLHRDGYPDEAGKILYNHYNSEELVDKLLSFGDLSILGEIAETNPSYWQSNNYWQNDTERKCVSYRDRGETDVDAGHYKDYTTFEDENEVLYVDYVYLYCEDDDTWYIAFDGEWEGYKDRKLEEVI